MPLAPSTYAPGRAYTVLQYLAAVVATALGSAGLGTPERVYVTTGQPADDGCECGSLAITATRVYKSNGFPRDDSGVRLNCDIALVAVECTARLLGCAPGPTGSAAGNPDPPSTADLSANALLVLDQAELVLTTLQCALWGLAGPTAQPPQLTDYLVGASRLVTHEGGCSGLEQDFVIAFTNNFCGC